MVNDCWALDVLMSGPLRLQRLCGAEDDALGGADLMSGSCFQFMVVAKARSNTGMSTASDELKRM